MAGFDEHLAPIIGVDIDAITDESDLDDSCVEISSVVDENENELKVHAKQGYSKGRGTF